MSAPHETQAQRLTRRVQELRATGTYSTLGQGLGPSEPPNVKPDGWPTTCGSCGASWSAIGFDYADGFNCRECGRTDADE